MSIMFDPDRLEARPLFTEAQRNKLMKARQHYSLDKFCNDLRNTEESEVEFVFTSAFIEGCTYSRVDASNLLKNGYPAGDKPLHDALMLNNMQKAYRRVIALREHPEGTPGHGAPMSKTWIQHLHARLMLDLLPEDEVGVVRTKPVFIGDSDYEPLRDPYALNTQMNRIVENAARYDNPFEKAVYLHLNLCYLQYFADGNKRTARLMQTAALVQGGCAPLLFKHTKSADYLQSVVNYYEAGDYETYAQFFSQNYLQGVALRCDGPSPGL